MLKEAYEHDEGRRFVESDECPGRTSTHRNAKRVDKGLLFHQNKNLTDKEKRTCHIVVVSVSKDHMMKMKKVKKKKKMSGHC